VNGLPFFYVDKLQYFVIKINNYLTINKIVDNFLAKSLESNLKVSIFTGKTKTPKEMNTSHYPNVKSLIYGVLANATFDSIKDCRKKFIVNVLNLFSSIKGRINGSRITPIPICRKVAA
jgi:hypothetical protein